MRIHSWWLKSALAVAALMAQHGALSGELFAGDTYRLPRVDQSASDDWYVVRSQDHVQVAEPCEVCNACDDACGIGNWWDNTEIFVGGDSFASLGEFPVGGYNNNFGAVTGFNTGFALGDSRVRGQFGASYGAYDFKGRSTAETSALEQQVFLTGGLYKRSDIDACDRISWGVVYDALIDNNYGIFADELQLGQIRAIAGYAINERHEIGGWATLNVMQENTTIFGTLRPMKQANAYWQQNWQYGATTSLYVGAMDNADIGDWVVGFNGRAPLSERFAMYGGATYVAPSSPTGSPGSEEAQWNVFCGVVFTPGGKSVSRTVSGDPGLPLLPVANNSTLRVTN